MFSFILKLLAIFLSVVVDGSRVSITNNGYSNIVIAVSPNIDKSRAEDILGNIKTVVGRASTVLYRATRERAYFRSVHILIPQTWDRVNANVSTWETFNVSHRTYIKQIDSIECINTTYIYLFDLFV